MEMARIFELNCDENSSTLIISNIKYKNKKSKVKQIQTLNRTFLKIIQS